MQTIQKRRNRIAGHFADLRLVHERRVKQIGRVLLLHILAILTIHALLIPVLVLFPLRRRRRSRDIKPHLHHLILRRARFPALTPRPSQHPIRSRLITIRRKRKLDRDLVFARQVRVRNLRVGNLESGLVLHVEGELGFAEVGLAPVPAAQRVLFQFEVDAVEEFEGFGDAVEVLLEHH